jgi:hypothetical protein
MTLKGAGGQFRTLFLSLVFPYGNLDLSVGHKSTKEKFMKRSLLITLIVLFAFSFAFIACNDNESDADPDLNAKWLNAGNGYEFKSGEYTEFQGEKPLKKGTYVAKDNKITLDVTDVNFGNSKYGGNGDAENWQSKESVLALLKVTQAPAYFSTDAIIENEFKQMKWTYFVDGKYLFFVHYAENGDMDDSVIYIK